MTAKTFEHLTAYERYQRVGSFDAPRPRMQPRMRRLHTRRQPYESLSPMSARPTSTLGKILLIVCAILFPPLAVFLLRGLRGSFWLNVLLTILGYLPGQVHAVWVILRRT